MPRSRAIHRRKASKLCEDMALVRRLLRHPRLIKSLGHADRLILDDFGLEPLDTAGLLSALLGIGSGVLKIPAMDAALRLPIKVSSATSNFMIGATAAASAGTYFMFRAIVPEIAGPVALGSVVGAFLGARLLAFVAPSKLRLAFVAVLLLLAVQMALAAFGVHRGL
jgi:uncharacterized membrane protein YfcA